jgi:hypothetical protein
VPKLDDFDIHRVSADSSFVSRAFELDVRRVICFFCTGEFPNYAILNGHEGRAMKRYISRSRVFVSITITPSKSPAPNASGESDTNLRH